MTYPYVRRVDVRLYPEAILKQAADAFADRCKVAIRREKDNLSVLIDVVDDGGDDVAHEFFNFALAAALELHLQAG